MKPLVAAFASVVALLTYGLLFGDRPTPDQKTASILACEKRIVDRLKAPSTYERINATYREERPFTRLWWRTITDDYPHLNPAIEAEKELRDELMAIAERYERDGYQVRTIILEYDAQNSFGAVLRNRRICDIVMAPDALITDGKGAAEFVIDSDRFY